jgi:Zn-dependent membrane protease YugP
MSKTQEGIEKRIEKVNYYQNKQFESFYIFHRHITTISLGFIGLFIGLIPENLSLQNKYLFVSTVILFGLSILFSLITQHGETLFYKNSVRAREKMLLEYIDSVDGIKFQSEHTDINKVYKVSEKLTYVCLLLSILSLIIYVCYLVFNK